LLTLAMYGERIMGSTTRVRKLKLYIFADSFQTIHQGQLRTAGYDPAWACVCKEVEIPDEGREPPDNLLQAARFARETPLGDTMVVDLAQTRALGREPVTDTFQGTFDGKPATLRFLVGFTAKQGE
jgi:hypothetical protein